MNNIDITESLLQKKGWSKVGNTFYRNGKALSHFDGKFQVWNNGQYHTVKTFEEIQFVLDQAQKKPS